MTLCVLLLVCTPPTPTQDGLAESMHLSTQPLPVPDRTDDGVFLRLLALKKGCTLLAATLRVVAPPGLLDQGAANLRIVWATLRNARKIFSAAPKDDRPAVEVQASMTDEETRVTSKIAASLVGTLERVDGSDDVASCMGALVYGDLAGQGEAETLLPLLAPGMHTESK